MKNILLGLSLFLLTMMVVPVLGQEKVVPGEAGEQKTLLKQSGICQEPKAMMLNWLLARVDEAQVRWENKYESIKTVEDIEKYQREHIDYFRKQLGRTWSKTPLNARITETMKRDGYHVEKIVFESLPGFYVTGTMFLPNKEKHPGPWPGMLEVCGHSATGKAASWMQEVCILGAMNGVAVFMIDPVEQGERWQLLDKDGNAEYTSVPAHNLLGSGSILLGRNTATFEIWDMTRALDYMQTRSDLLQTGFGVAGISGGGTQTSYIMALDKRIKAAAPCCYICNIFDNLMYVNGPQDAEQNIFGQTGFGMDHADYCIMRAPQPTLLCTTTNDFFNIDDAWKSFRYAKRIYSRFGWPEKMAIIEKEDKHNYAKELQEGTIRWMLRWLANKDVEVWRPDQLPVLTEDEIRTVPKPGVMALPNARTTYDLNRDLAKELTPKREAIWKDMTPEKAADLVRSVAGIRKLADLPSAKVCDQGKTETDFVLESDAGIYLPIRTNIKETPAEMTLVISDKGRFSEKTNLLFTTQGKSVMAVDLRGWGETQAEGRTYYLYQWFGTDGSDYYIAYLLGKSYVGMRTDDLLMTAKFCQEKYGAKIHLVAEGYAGTVALHAAIAEPALFESVKIEEKALVNWNTSVEKSPTYIQLTDTIHGVLNYYDTNNLLDFVKTTLFNRSK